MRRTVALLLLAAACWPSAALAQQPSDPQPTLVILRPAAEPVPALKYRLVPEQISLVRGNAAPFYYRGVIIMTETYSSLRAKERGQPGAFPDSVERLASDTWLVCPISEIPRDQARKYLEPFQNALKEVEIGVLRSTCDWEFDQRTEGMFLQLPEIQDLRGLARILQLQARLAILDGKTDAAMHWIETGLVLGRHISQGPLMIQALIGVSIDLSMTRRLEELIQARSTPSLYWALADRPRPLIDMRHSIEGEGYALEKELPELRELDRGPWSLEDARRFADTLQRQFYNLGADAPLPGGDPAATMDLAELSRRLGIAAIAAKIYPEAKRALIARGRPEAQVEAMPIIQVAALDSMEKYRRIRDDTYKWMNVPYWQSYNRIDRAIAFTMHEKLANPFLTAFLSLMPALNSVRLVGTRLERQLDAMQCIEAIRLYAHAHVGKLPASLEAITDAPVPLDSATGKPFLYHVNGDSATLSAPVPPGQISPAYAIRYDLKLAQ